MARRAAEVLQHLLHEDAPQQDARLRGVHLAAETLQSRAHKIGYDDMRLALRHLCLRDERQRQHAGVVGDEDGVHVGVGEHPRLRGQHLGLAVHQRGAGPGTRAHLAL